MCADAFTFYNIHTIMATSLLALLDDITTMLDDVAAMSKVAVKKTAGVLGDDLALNAEQVTGVEAKRELPVVWAVFKGSMLNKFILVPLALLISAFLPWLITPLLMAGGLFLCFEGVEKVLHKFLHKNETGSAQKQETEKDKIKGAVRTDFILSAEIVVITLGSMAAGTPLLQRIMVLALIAFGMTFGVYGLVAGIVKLDDLGLLLYKKGGALRSVGKLLLRGVPWLMRGLSVVGTIAMFLVGGGILAHAIAPLVQWLHHIELSWGGLLSSLAGMAINLVVGLAAGALVLVVVQLIKKMTGKKTT